MEYKLTNLRGYEGFEELAILARTTIDKNTKPLDIKIEQLQAEAKSKNLEISRLETIRRRQAKEIKRLKAEIKFLQETYIKDPPHKGGAS